MSSRPPASNVVFNVVLKLCLLYISLPAAAVSHNVGESANILHEAIQDDRTKPSTQMEIYRMCYRLVVDQALSHVYDWNESDEVEEIKKRFTLNQKYDHPYVKTQSTLYAKRPAVNKVYSNSDKNAPFEFSERGTRIPQQPASSLFEVLFDAQSQNSRDIDNYCLNFVLSKIINIFSTHSFANREEGNERGKTASEVLELKSDDSKDKPSRFALFRQDFQGHPYNKNTIPTLFTGNGDNQVQKRESSSSTFSKRGYSGWLGMARRAVKRRRHHLSINNALMTLTDMVLEESIQRVLRNRANMRRHMLIQG